MQLWQRVQQDGIRDAMPIELECMLHYLVEIVSLRSLCELSHCEICVSRH
jgi:hypothetical protein